MATGQLKGLGAYEPDGILKIIPKSGAKGRVIALLSEGLQALHEPSHRLLDKFRDTLSVFCYQTQGKMIPNKLSISTDLSNATDRLPLDLFEKF